MSTAPKRNKKASKKTKKSWRKNTDLDDVEDFLEDQRLEERLGGAFKDRPDEDLFVVDVEAKVDDDGGGSKGQSHRLARRKKLAEGPLKCFRNLEVTSGVKDPKKGRNRRRLPEERVNPVVKAMELKRAQQGIVKAKIAEGKRNRMEQQAAKLATTLDRLTRRRTKFDFDLWDDVKVDKDAAAIKSNEWFHPDTKKHNLKGLNKFKRQVPVDYLVKPSTASSVETPHSGSSYNPSYKDHQDLLWRAAITEINKEKAHQRIEYHTTRMFPKAEDAPTQQTWIKEMSEGLNNKDDDDKEEEEEEALDDDEEEKGVETETAKLRTRKQRRKEKERKAEARKLKFSKDDKLKSQDVYRLKSFKKMLSAQERLTSERIKRRKLTAVLKMTQAAKLSAHNYEEPDLDIKLSDELTGNLRSLKPEGNLLEDRFKSMQKRNIIETRVKHKIERKNHKRKKVEKRSYKMPWDKQEQMTV